MLATAVSPTDATHDELADAPTTGAPYPAGTKVEVHSTFDRRWTRGFEVVAHGDAGYRLRRLSDGAELPRLFTRDELRRERRRGQWWY